MVVYLANNRLFGLAIHNRLSLFLPLSFSSPSYFPPFSKQAKRKTKLRFAGTLPVQDAGPTLALDEVASRTELELLQCTPRCAVRLVVEENFSGQTKLASTTGFLKQTCSLASLGMARQSLDWHPCTVGGPNTMLNECVALAQTTEPNRKFCSVQGRSNRTFGWIFGKMRHYFFTLTPAAARFRQSFRNSVCKTSLIM